jgi:hypothetical protein
MDKGYTRKELSAKLAIGTGALRYYENAGIIPKPARTNPKKGGKLADCVLLVEKARIYAEQFPIECKKAYDIGAGLVDQISGNKQMS